MRAKEFWLYFCCVCFMQQDLKLCEDINVEAEVVYSLFELRL